MICLSQKTNLGMSSAINSPMHSNMSPLNYFINEGAGGNLDFLVIDFYRMGDYEEDIDFLNGEKLLYSEEAVIVTL